MGETALFLKEGTLVANKSTTDLWMCFCVDKPAKILMDACLHREYSLFESAIVILQITFC